MYNRNYMKKLLFFISIGIVSLLIGVFAVDSSVSAQIGQGGVWGGINATRGEGVPTSLGDGDESIVTRIINMMLYAIVVISVVMLIVGGFRYVISGGQKEAVTAAKNTILYAIIGLLIAIFAYPVTVFILNIVMGTGGGTDI